MMVAQVVERHVFLQGKITNCIANSVRGVGLQIAVVDVVYLVESVGNMKAECITVDYLALPTSLLRWLTTCLTKM